MTQHDQRLGLRVSTPLRDAVVALGEPSAVARSLLLLGLHSAGQDVSDLCGDAWADVPALRSPALQRALLAVLNIGSTHVEHTPAPASEPGRPASDDDAPGLWDIGIEV